MILRVEGGNRTHDHPFNRAGNIEHCDVRGCPYERDPLPVARVHLPRRLLALVFRRPTEITRFNVCRNGHVIPDAGSTWCEDCDSARAYRRPPPTSLPGPGVPTSR